MRAHVPVMALILGALLLGAARGQDVPLDDPAAVEPAIQRGSAWLLAETRGLRLRIEAGSPRAQSLGALSLQVMALLRSGVPASELGPELALIQELPIPQVYEASLLVLALEARSVERVPPAPGAIHPEFRPHPPDRATLRAMARPVTWLLDCEANGTWGYGGGAARENFDHSNTQFAVYALHAASVHGLSVPRAVFERILRHHLKVQGIAPGLAGRLSDLSMQTGVVRLGPDSPLAAAIRPAPAARPDARPEPPAADDRGGTRTRTGQPTRARRQGESIGRWSAGLRGWGYRAVHFAPTLAMTAAGLSSVAMAAERCEALGLARVRSGRGQVARALLDGAALTIALQRERPAGGGARGGYDLLSIEKGLDSVGLEEVDGRSWWWDEARWVLAAQRPDGSWPGTYGDQLETAFALLFLNRATLAPFERRDRNGPKAGTPASAPPAGRVRTGPGGAADGPSLVLASGQVTALDQLFSTAAVVGGRDARPVRDELEQAWEVMPALERLRFHGALLALAGQARDGQVQSWARRARRDLLEGTDATRDAAAQSLAGALTALESVDLTAAEPPAQVEIEAARAIVLELLRTPNVPTAFRRAALQALARLADPDAVPFLLDDLDGRDPAARRIAWPLLVAIAGEAVPFDPDGRVAERARGVRAWRAWWEGEGGQALRAPREGR